MGQPKKIIAISMMLTIFVLMVSLAAIYVQAQIDAGTVCTCAIPLPVLVPLLSSIGLLVGTLLYYMFSPEGKRLKPPDPGILLDFLEKEESEILKILIQKKGEVSQAGIVSLTGLAKVKVFRVIERLKKKGIISKEPHGKTNLIKLNEDIRKIFVQ